MFGLKDTPYSLDQEAESFFIEKINEIEERVRILRNTGKLNEKTLMNYYGEKRFEQVAESNAIEGSTLSAGETELAILKGVTITGHDPAYVRDALALDKALTRITELAKDRESATKIINIREIHNFILGDRPGAGIFRSEPVAIRGAKHVPPKTWNEIMSSMEELEKWSVVMKELAAPIRAAVLHAWIAHIHPYIDGNGRLARAVGNLELIRAGYPPIIIKKKDRDRYLECLSESDEGGDIRSFLQLIVEKVTASLRGLEVSATKKQGFNPVLEKLKENQKRQLNVINTSIRLLATMIESYSSDILSDVSGSCSSKVYEIDFEDYIDLCDGNNISASWNFHISLQIPGNSALEKLVWSGPRSSKMYNHLDKVGGLSLYWSSRASTGAHRWASDNANSPYMIEATSLPGVGDEWYIRLVENDEIIKISITALAKKVADQLIANLSSSIES